MSTDSKNKSFRRNFQFKHFLQIALMVNETPFGMHHHSAAGLSQPTKTVDSGYVSYEIEKRARKKKSRAHDFHHCRLMNHNLLLALAN